MSCLTALHAICTIASDASVLSVEVCALLKKFMFYVNVYITCIERQNDMINKNYIIANEAAGKS